MITASNRQHTLGGDGCGNLAMLRPPGNPDTHPVPSGRHRLTNYDAASIAAALDELQQNNCHAKVMVDCSHANACKQHERQIPIAKEVIAQRTQGNKGRSEEHTSELQSRPHLVCRLLLEKKNK